MSTKYNNAMIAKNLLGCDVVFGGNTQPFDKCGCEDNRHSEYDIVTETYYRIKNYYTSRTAVWQVIDAMERNGYQLIVSGPTPTLQLYNVSFVKGDLKFTSSETSFNGSVCNAALDFLAANGMLNETSNVVSLS